MLSDVFNKAKADNRKVFIPYFPAGYPTLAKSKKAFKQIAKSGADIIEVGIPFSDPLADGPTIQKASTVALDAGLKIEQVFKALGEIKGSLPPTIIMTYYNLLYANGLKNFARKAARAGVAGVIIPDLPVDESGEWVRLSKDHVETVFLAAPTSSDERIKKIDKATTSFIYCVSVTGVTGALSELPRSLSSFLKRVKTVAKNPVAVGFGVSKKEQVKQINKIADGVIVGSAIIKAYEKAKNEKDALKNVDSLIRKLTS